jgi:hypothetical protein
MHEVNALDLEEYFGSKKELISFIIVLSNIEPIDVRFKVRTDMLHRGASPTTVIDN